MRKFFLPHFSRLYADTHLLRLHEFLSSPNGKYIIDDIHCRWHVEQLEKCMCTSLYSNPINGHFTIHSEKTTLICFSQIYLSHSHFSFFVMYWRRFIILFRTKPTLQDAEFVTEVSNNVLNYPANMFLWDIMDCQMNKRYINIRNEILLIGDTSGFNINCQIVFGFIFE